MLRAALKVRSKWYDTSVKLERDNGALSTSTPWKNAIVFEGCTWAFTHSRADVSNSAVDRLDGSTRGILTARFMLQWQSASLEASRAATSLDIGAS